MGVWSPLDQFPDFWLYIPCLYADFSINTHRLFEVRHNLLIKNLVDEMHITSDETHHTIELIKNLKG